MANEATLRIETEPAIMFNCADDTEIEKGAVLKLTDNMTAELSDGDSDNVAGVAATDKVADNGITKIGVYRRGVFLMNAEGSISVGDPVVTAASTGEENQVMAASTDDESYLGIAMEDASDGDNLLVELNPQEILA